MKRISTRQATITYNSKNNFDVLGKAYDLSNKKAILF